MKESYTESGKTGRNPIVDKNNNFQIGTLAKLFDCEYEEVLDAIEKSNGTFVSVYEVICGKKKDQHLSI